jgi:site-specific recombinase XerD
MGEDSLLERVTAAAQERQLSHNSLIAYRRTWLKIIAWAAAEGLSLETIQFTKVPFFFSNSVLPLSGRTSNSAVCRHNPIL